MHRTHVIATCCYCGNRAALNLGGTAVRHELACSGCGAPLSRMKNLPFEVAASRPVAPLAGPVRKKARKAAKPKKTRRRRGLKSRLVDLVEDVLDEVFD